MLRWLDRRPKQEESATPRPLYSLEQENKILHDMVHGIAVERNDYRIDNQRLRDENATLRRIIERNHYDTSGTH
ncbi:hypothetical protein GUT189_10040 [Streptococcus ruminantium]|nr:hypothetical protein GUT189_10040 [Streptococcus ruminantium]